MEQQSNKNTALLVMDIQGATIKMLRENAPVVNAVTKVIQSARAFDMPVIYVTVAFRKGYPEVSPDNKSFSQIKNSDMKLDAEEGYKVHPSLSPQPNDIVILKKRVSAFTGSDLEVVLRSFGIKHLVLTGIATSGVILSTIREAADKDYILTVLADCCADRDEEVHRVLTTKVFPRQAEVMNAEEWIFKNNS